MKISVREKNGKGLNIRVPMGVCRFFIKTGMFGLRHSKDYIDEEALKYCNPKLMDMALKELNKNYKGLTIVEVQDRDGDHVKITI
jgi:hypothetical protein